MRERERGRGIEKRMKESEREKKVKANKREKKLEQIAEVLT